jgi:hypothetical protein
MHQATVKNIKDVMGDHWNMAVDGEAGLSLRVVFGVVTP